MGAAFGAVQHRLGVVLAAIAGGPLLHLVPSAAAEPEQFVPEVFHQEQDAGDHLLLLPLVVAKSVAVDVDVKPAGTALVAGVAHVDGLGHHIGPGHFGEVIVQGHGVGDDLHAVFQRAVMLDVDVFMVLVGNGHEPTGPAVALAALVDLQLHAKVADARAVKDGVGFVIVGLDALRMGAVAGVAVAVVILAGQIVQIITEHQPSTAAAISVLVQAGAAQAHVLLLVHPAPAKPLAAVVADGRQLVQAVGAVKLALEVPELAERVGLAAMGAQGGFSHRPHLF